MIGINHNCIRYHIIAPLKTAQERYAAAELSKAVGHYVPYVLTISDDNISPQSLKEHHLLILGKLNTNSLFSQYDKAFTPAFEKEGFSIKMCESCLNPQRKVFLLQGADDAGVLYAVRDFQHFYIQNTLKYNGYIYDALYKPFLDEPLNFERKSAPQIEYRGLWSWGHAIYDYKAYIDNLTRFKMNTLIIWNDHVPINAKEVIAYAHERCVKIIWGYSWCWGSTVNPDNKQEMNYWAKRALEIYENEYLPLGVDGIYFQSFTETQDTQINGKLIAEKVTEWTNKISKKLLKKYPSLWIQFGLHASSIKNNYTALAKIPPQITINWEDAGSFPYNYMPEKTQDFEETLNYTKKLLQLRGKEERFSCVLKGMTVLNWPTFEHQQGTFVMGQADEGYIKHRQKEKEFFWKYVTPYWITNAELLQRFVKTVAHSKLKDICITALAEDGLFEKACYFPVALLSEILWNPDEDTQSLIAEIMHCDDCVCL